MDEAIRNVKDWKIELNIDDPKDITDYLEINLIYDKDRTIEIYQP